MNVEQFRDYCISKKGVTEELPFGDHTLVYKVSNKIFALAGIENFTSFNVKCDPEEAVQLREKFPSVKPGFHMNKKHWNTVEIDGSIPLLLLYTWIDNSYNLVIDSLPSKDRSRLKSI